MKWILNGQRHLLTDRHGEKIITCGYRSSVVHRTIHMKNDNWTTINKKITCKVATLKKVIELSSFCNKY